MVKYIAIFLLLPVVLLGAVSINEEPYDDNIYKITFTWTSGSDGSVTGTTTNRYTGTILRLEFSPSTSAIPSDNYDIVVWDSNDLDVLNGYGANLDSVNDYTVATAFGAVLNTKLQIRVSNAGNSKSGTLIMYLGDGQDIDFTYTSTPDDTTLESTSAGYLRVKAGGLDSTHIAAGSVAGTDLADTAKDTVKSIVADSSSAVRTLFRSEITDTLGAIDADRIAEGTTNKYVTAANVGAVSDNLDDTDASVEWEDATDLESDGSLSVDVVDSTNIASASVAGTDLADTAKDTMRIIISDSSLAIRTLFRSEITDTIAAINTDRIAEGATNKYVTAANVGAVSANLDNADASVEWEDALGLTSTGAIAANAVDSSNVTDASIAGSDLAETAKDTVKAIFRPEITDSLDALADLENDGSLSANVVGYAEIDTLGAGVVDVRKFDSLSTAISYVASNYSDSERPSIYLPAGTYTINSQIDISAKNISIVGDGQYSKIVFNTTSTDTLFNLGAFESSPASIYGGSAQGFKLENLYIINDNEDEIANEGGRNSVGVSDNGCGGLIIRGCYFRGFKFAIHGSYGSDFSTIEFNRFANNDTALYMGYGGQQHSINYNQVYANDVGFYFEGVNYGQINYNYFIDNASYDMVFAHDTNTVPGISNPGNSYAEYEESLIGNYFESGAGYRASNVQDDFILLKSDIASSLPRNLTFKNSRVVAGGFAAGDTVGSFINATQGSKITVDGLTVSGDRLNYVINNAIATSEFYVENYKLVDGYTGVDTLSNYNSGYTAVSETWGGTHNYLGLKIDYKDRTSSKHVYIDGVNGRIGIGTTSPSRGIHVVNDRIYMSGAAELFFVMEAATNNYMDANTGAFLIRTRTEKDIIFSTNTTEAMRIQEDQNVNFADSVAINKGTAPTEALDVNGDIAADSIKAALRPSDVGAASANLDNTDASIEWEDAAALESDGSLSTGSVDSTNLVNSSVNSAEITDDTIVDADVNSAAAIAGSKISPDFGAQNIATTGNASVDTLNSGDVQTNTITASDSLSIGAGGFHIRNLFQSATGDSVGMLYYNTVAARIDTVWWTQ